MEKSRKIAGLCLALIFIIIFLLTSVIALESDGRVIQTYKSYENTKITEVTTYKSYENTKITEVTINPTRISHSTNWDCGTHYYPKRKYINTIHYTQYGTQESRKSFLGDYVKTYSVYITNRGTTGRYFTVVFNFEDKNGYEFSESVTQYLRSGERKKFVYRDIQYERNEILDWDYEIVPRRY